MTTPAAHTDARTAEPHPLHAHCVVCRSTQDSGLGLRFEPRDDGSVIAEFDCDPACQGYGDCIHGGVIAMLHDAAMTNCLFRHDIVALTAKMSIRYAEPLAVGRPATVRAWLTHASPPGYRLKSEILQEGRATSTAEAVFCDQRRRRNRASRPGRESRPQ